MAGRVSKRNAGDALNIPAKEWNAIADAVNFGVSQSRGGGQLAQSITVLVRNDTGDDLDRFDCASLGAPLFTLETDGSADLIFSLVKADKDKPPAILTEPIAHNATNKRYGRVWIHGLAYAFVGPGGTTSQYGLPTATNNRLTPGSGDIRLLAAPSASAETLLPVLLGGGRSTGTGILFTTRAAGIAARTTTTLPHTFPSAICDLIDPATGNHYSPNREELIFNSTSVPIAHVTARVHQAKSLEGRYFIDVSDCG